MKTTATLLLLFLPLPFMGQSIPNGNFEDWTPFIWTLEPDGWETQNAEVVEYVTQDQDAFQGEYAMKVTAIPNGLGSFGDAVTTFDTDLIPASLDFYVKTSCIFGSTSVTIRFFNEETEVYTAYWSSSDSIQEWTPISLQLDQIEPILTHASIQVMAEVGDLVPGMAEISVDSMGFNLFLNNTDLELNPVSVFPNPCVDQLNVISESSLLSGLRLYNSLGMLVKSVPESSTRYKLDLSSLPRGMYFLETLDALERRRTYKIIAE